MNRRHLLGSCVAAGFLWGTPLAIFAQDAKKNPPAANPNLAKLPRNAQRTLAQYRRRVGRQLRGGPDDFYVVMTGEIVDTPREPTLLESLTGFLLLGSVVWDFFMLPVVFASGDTDLLLSDNIPKSGPTIDRKYSHQIRIVQGKVAAIQLVYDHTTELVGVPPDPKRRVYRGWSQAGTAKTKEAAEARKAEIEKLTNAPPAGGPGLAENLEQLKKFFQKPDFNPAEEGEKK